MLQALVSLFRDSSKQNFVRSTGDQLLFNVVSSDDRKDDVAPLIRLLQSFDTKFYPISNGDKRVPMWKASMSLRMTDLNILFHTKDLDINRLVKLAPELNADDQIWMQPVKVILVSVDGEDYFSPLHAQTTVPMYLADKKTLRNLILAIVDYRETIITRKTMQSLKLEDLMRRYEQGTQCLVHPEQRHSRELEAAVDSKISQLAIQYVKCESCQKDILKILAQTHRRWCAVQVECCCHVGCTVKLPRREMSTHKRVCDHELVICWNKNCGFQTKRKFLDDHLRACYKLSFLNTVRRTGLISCHQSNQGSGKRVKQEMSEKWKVSGRFHSSSKPSASIAHINPQLKDKILGDWLKQTKDITKSDGILPNPASVVVKLHNRYSMEKEWLATSDFAKINLESKLKCRTEYQDILNEKNRICHEEKVQDNYAWFRAMIKKAPHLYYELLPQQSLSTLSQWASNELPLAVM